MVDLPSIPDRLVTTQAPSFGQPQSGLVPLAEGLGGAAASLSQIGQDIQRQQAPARAAARQRAASQGVADVGQDAQGNPTIKLLPDTDEDAATHNASAIETYVAQQSTAAEQQFLQLANNHAGDFPGYQKATADLIAKRAADAKLVDPRLEGGVLTSLRRSADRYGLQLASNAQSRSIQSNLNAVTTRLKDLDDTAMNLAAQPGGVDGDDFKGTAKEYQGYLQQRVANPHDSFSQAQADSAMRDFTSRATVAAAVPLVNEAYQGGMKISATAAYAAGMAKAKEIADSPKLSMSPAERATTYQSLTTSMKQVETERKGQVQALDGQSTQLITGMNSGVQYGQDDVGAVVQQYLALGETSKAARFKALATRQLGKSVFHDASPAERLQILKSGVPQVRSPLLDTRRGGAAPDPALGPNAGDKPFTPGASAPAAPAGPTGNLFQLFSAKDAQYGLPPGTMKGFASIETGGKFNTDAHNDSGADGLMQFMPGTAKQYGVNTRDAVSSVDGAARYAVDNMKALRLGTGQQPDAADLYLAHQQGVGKQGGPGKGTGAIGLIQNPDAPAASIIGLKAVLANGGTQGMTSGQFRAMWRARFDKGAGTTSGAGQDPTFPLEPTPSVTDLAIAQYQVQVVNQDFEHASIPIMDAVSKGQPISTADAQYLVDVRPFLTGTNVEKFQTIAQTGQFTDELSGAGPVQRQRLLDAHALAVSQGAEAPMRAAYNDGVALDRQLTELEQKNPIGRGYSARWAKPVELNRNDPTTFMQRGKDAQTIGIRLGRPVGMFQPAEADNLTEFLRSAPADQAVGVLNMIRQSMAGNAEGYRATLAQIHQADPGSPVAYAGGLAETNPAMAASVLRGARALDADSKLAFSKDDKDEPAATQKLLPTTAFGPGGTEIFAAVKTAARARYADLSQQTGDTSGQFNENRWTRSMRDVTGGVLQFQGQPIVAPVAGMSQPEFDARIKGLTDTDLAGAGTPSGKPFTATMLQHGYGYRPDLRPGPRGPVQAGVVSIYPRLQLFADGRYLINMGTNDAPMYVQQQPLDAKDLPGPYVLDLRDPQRAGAR